LARSSRLTFNVVGLVVDAIMMMMMVVMAESVKLVPLDQEFELDN
jgi:hypothetical protein